MNIPRNRGIGAEDISSAPPQNETNSNASSSDDANTTADQLTIDENGYIYLNGDLLQYSSDTSVYNGFSSSLTTTDISVTATDSTMSNIRGMTTNGIYLDEAATTIADPIRWQYTDSNAYTANLNISDDNSIAFGFNNGSRIKIDQDGTFVLDDVSNSTTQEFNIFELTSRIDRLEELVHTLTSSIPKKLTGQILRSKAEL